MTQVDVNKVIRTITRNLVLVLAPFILTGIGIQVSDHFTLKNKVDRQEYYQSHMDLILLIEKKTRALESIAKSNTQDVMYLKVEIEKMEEYQKEIDKYLREAYRVRGHNNELPEY